MALGVVLILALFAVCATFATPTQIEANVSRVHYTNTGKFSYVAYLKPSYLLGPEPTDDSVLSNPKYPTEDVDSFNFTFAYHLDSNETLTNTSEIVRVTATGDDQDGGMREAITILPEQQTNGDNFTIDFQFNPESISAGDVTLAVSVIPAIETSNGLVFESFRQSLIIHNKDGVFEVERSGLNHSESATIGDLTLKQDSILKYTVSLNSASQFAQTVVAAPPDNPIQPDSATIVVGMDEPIFNRLVDKLDFQLHYNFATDTAIHDFKEQVSVVALLESPGVWKKEITLVEPVLANGKLDLPFTLDMTRLNQLLENIRNELGVPAQSYTLTIRADIQMTGQTKDGPLNDVFNPTLTTALDKGAIKWQEKMVQSKAGAIVTNVVQPNNTKYFGLSLVAVRIIALVFFILVAFVFALAVILKLRETRPENSPIQLEYERIVKRFGNRIIEAVSGPQTTNIVNFARITDLVKVADESGKPVLHGRANNVSDGHIFSVVDGVTCYQYILGGSLSEASQGMDRTSGK